MSILTRPNHPIPEYVRRALEKRGLMESYHHRPAYQQNKYISWITRVKRVETQFKHLNQMLD